MPTFDLNEYPDNYVTLFDTTLRDGAQTIGVDMSYHEKRRIAGLLDRFGLDYIEGGFPGANPVDTAFFGEPMDLESSTMVAFGRTVVSGRSPQNDPGFAALFNAKASSVCLVGKSSLTHVTKALGITPKENLESIAKSMKAITDNGQEAMLDMEHAIDAFKEDPVYFYRVAKTALDNGARWVVLCDTNGGSMPEDVVEAVKYLTGHGIDGRQLGIHTHDDCDMAVANSLAAVRAGVRMVQGTINGIGERAGNAALEEVAMALHLHQDEYERPHKLDVSQLAPLCSLVSELTGIALSPMKPIGGSNIFATEAGIHQDGLLKNPDTYLPYRPETVGAEGVKLVLGRHSGRKAILHRLHELGREPSEQIVQRVMQAIKELPKGELVDDDLLLKLSS